MLPFTKKIDQQIQHLDMAWEYNSGRGRGGIRILNQFKSANAGGGGRGESWRFQVMDALYISINDPRKWGSNKKKKCRNETRTSQILAKHYFQPQVPN